MNSNYMICIGILSGGESRRLGGRDKGLIPVDGELQVMRAANLVAGTGAILVSANRHLVEYRSLGFQVVPDTHEDSRGPLAGVSALLAVCPCPWLMTLPVDVIAVPGDLPSQLMALLGRSGVAIARVRDGDGLQPAVALYRASLAASAAQALADGAYSLQRWQQAQGCVELRLAGSVGNRNVPADYPPESF